MKRRWHRLNQVVRCVMSNVSVSNDVIFEMTVYKKSKGGLLSKSINLNEDHSLKVDGSQCKMCSGSARKVALTGVIPSPTDHHP